MIYMKVNLPYIQQETLEYDLTPIELSFKATAGNASKNIKEEEYEFKIEFNKDVLPEKSSKKLTPRTLLMAIRKKEIGKAFWPQLTKGKRPAFLTIDFSQVSRQEMESRLKEFTNV